MRIELMWYKYSMKMTWMRIELMWYKHSMEVTWMRIDLMWYKHSTKMITSLLRMITSLLRIDSGSLESVFRVRMAYFRNVK